MINVLVVDDNSRRSRRISEIISEHKFAGESRVVEVDAIIPAKKALKDEVFDILVVDLALPLRSGSEILAEGGLQLLRALDEDDVLQMPTHIIAITAFDDLKQSVSTEFEGRGITILRVENSSEDWEAEFSRVLKRFYQATTSLESREHTFGRDIAVVCALANPEFSSLKNIPWNWRTITYKGDATRYSEGVTQGRSGPISVVGATTARMGMPAATALAMKMAFKFRPKYLAMIGICAGNENRSKFGDVIFADPVWDSGSGKWHSRDGEREFAQAPHQLPLAGIVREAARELSTDAGLLSTIRRNWPAAKPDHELNVLVGPMASTAAVVAEEVSLAAIIAQHRETLGFDMESFGVFSAAETATDPLPTPFVLKSVVDFGNSQKDDRFREYAAYASANVFKEFVERFL